MDQISGTSLEKRWRSINQDKDSNTLSHIYDQYLTTSLLYCGKDQKKNWTSFWQDSLTKDRNVETKISSVMERDDSWPATVPSVVLSLRYSLSKKMTWKHLKWGNGTSDRESDGIFWTGKPGFLFEFPSNHMSISLSIRDTQTDRQTDGRTDNADHHYSRPPHCGGPANKNVLAMLEVIVLYNQ